MSDAHIGEDAELFALGSLSQAEQMRVRAHIANCASCLRRVGLAEETVLALERQHAAPAAPKLGIRFDTPRGLPLWARGAVIAAAAMLAGYFFPHPQAEPDATRALIASHFSHAQFVGSGPPAKVLYARDGSWYYVIVDGSHRYRVIGTTSTGASTQLGTTTARTGTSALFVRSNVRFTNIALEEGTQPIETAQIR